MNITFNSNSNPFTAPSASTTNQKDQSHANSELESYFVQIRFELDFIYFYIFLLINGRPTQWAP